MTIEITARHFSPSSQLNDLVNKKIGKIERYHDNITSCHVILVKENSHESVQIKAHVKGHDIFAEESSPVFEKSLTTAVDKVIKQLKKTRDKVIG